MEKLFDIIFEDDELLVINKPAGLVCHPTKNGELSSLIGRARLHLLPTVNSSASAEGSGATAPKRPAATVREHDGNEGGQPSTIVQPHLVNRLDRETSGVVIVAKNPVVAGELGKILEGRAIEKEYIAIVHGHVRDDHGIIDAPLGKDERSLVAIKDCVRPDGAASQTEFWVKRRFSHPSTLNFPPPGATKLSAGGSTFSLLRIVPRTGRKHQIRIHLAQLGHAIVGDKLYGGDEDLYLALVENRLTGAQRARLIFENHALHARAVRFGWRDREMEFACDPEPWFTGFLAKDKIR